MATTNQEFIDNLIAVIMNAEDPESVTNQMVATVMEFLNQKCKDLLENNTGIQEEATQRRAADQALQQTLQLLTGTVNGLSLQLSQTASKAQSNADAINSLMNGNVSQAIDSFNEVIAFLNGIKDTETLQAKLTAIGEHITDVEQSAENLTQNLSDLEEALNERLNAELAKIRTANSASKELLEEEIKTLRQDHNNDLQTLRNDIAAMPRYGNCYNVTNEQPKVGFYDLEAAITATKTAVAIGMGMQITFAIAQGSWKTYQYVGLDSEDAHISDTANWIDLAGMSAGSEAVINVDALCPRAVAGFYTKATAVDAVAALYESTKIDYKKSGLVITFRVSEYGWESYQFVGAASDFTSYELWQPFGAGGDAQVQTSDTPTEDGEDAFSTGGAYQHVPADITVDTETEGVVKLQLVNAAGEAVGNERQFAVGTGTGTAGVIMEITPQVSPLYGQAGGTMEVRCAITLKDGTDYSSGIVEKVEVYDRDSEALLETFKLNKSTSANSTDYDFSFDLSRYFTQASARRFRFVAYDDAERTARRNVNITAVDVTIKSEQTLNYSPTTVLAVAGGTRQLPMYRFANNASEKGILVSTEILLNGEWQLLGKATVSDTYTHSITINPNDCCGRVLSHGAYALRIHGEDVASGVVGNYLHTAVMVVDASDDTPIVVARWYTEKPWGEVRQYESVSIDFAAYDPQNSSMAIEIEETAEGHATHTQTTTCSRGSTYNYTKRVSGYKTDGSQTISITAKSGPQSSETAQYKVVGSLLNIESVSAQVALEMDFTERSNAQQDKSITDRGYSLEVNGANYSTNGFVKDSFGSADYGTPADKGVMALRIAENVTAKLDYQPFNVAGVESNGLAIQFKIRARHIADDDARLISCIGNGYGFYATGRNVVFTVDGEATTAHTITSALKEDDTTDVAIVIEPTSQAPYGGIGVVKMYFDGELVGCCYYAEGSLTRHDTPITFDGTYADLYVYGLKMWETYFGFEESFNNYLLKLDNADDMITEYQFNSVMASQAAEGRPARSMPQMALLQERDIPSVVITKNADTADTPDNYPEYLETLDGDKKTARTYDWRVYFPKAPWRNVVITGVPTTNQGTTSSWRPVKNIRGKYSKCQGVEMMYPRTQFTDTLQLAEYDMLAALALKKRVQFFEGSIPTNVATIKVDYSESGGANNGAGCQLYNELQRALGENYMTPAQVAYFAEGGEYSLNPAIASVPCGLYRTDVNSPDATSPAYAYFHAKGNLNQDKSDAKVFGFEGVHGYNEGCLNYGDFTELVAARGQSLPEFDASIDKSTWNQAAIYVLTEFCGPDYKVYRFKDGAWTETTGTMEWRNGHWSITGDVLNPVENYELLAYNDMDWFQNVSTIDDMLRRDDQGKLVWLQQFESRYPDDDDLNQAYEDGRKLPYRLFKWLCWCNDCNQHKTQQDGQITIDDATVDGTVENRIRKFQRELHKEANVHSMVCYHVFTDYMAAVDQRSKNMMLGFYLEKTGDVRAYLNHLYDGDTVLGSDNDCGKSIPVLLDPNNDTQGYYQGHDSVLFTQLVNCDRLWLSDYVSEADEQDATKTVTVAAVAAAMRSVSVKSTGLRPFSPQGLMKYWITDRLSKWPKLVSSFDGLRKYVERSKESANYMYALHGLSVQFLQEFITTRFRFRDGFYKCGDTFASAAQMRCTGTEMSVTIKAAKDGFFALGVDRASEANGGSAYLHAGDVYTFYSHNTNLASGVMLYIYGADRIEELDIRNATPKQKGWDISALTLLKKLTLGGKNYSPATSNGDELSTLALGQLPFLEVVDARNFPLASIDASKCPRLKNILAEGTALRSLALAETAPIATLHLPATMSALALVNLPNISYPGTLTLEGYSDLTRLQVKGCPKVDSYRLLKDAADGGATLAEVSLSELNVSADSSLLDKLKADGTRGIASDMATGCDGISGRWILTTTVEDAELAALQSWFPVLQLHNCQFTVVCYSDDVNDSANMSNMENGTGYLFNNVYVPSGHITRYESMCHTYRCKLGADGKMHAKQISDSDYLHLADGSSFDPEDKAGTGNDVMHLQRDYWYKGINDYKNQRKYMCFCSFDHSQRPISAATLVERHRLGDLLLQANAAMSVRDVNVGDDCPQAIGDNSSFNVYEVSVAGMKQVRWPGVNDDSMGGIFLDADGKVVGTFNMFVENAHFDFTPGDYIFCDVSGGATKFRFTAFRDFDDAEVIAVDSDAIEAIEPDVVQRNQFLMGVYSMSVDSLKRARSVSGVQGKCGTGTSQTCPEWTYDANGNLTNTSVPASLANYTSQDCLNLCRMRGEGYHAIAYEESKDLANIIWLLIGDRNVQSVCGTGASSSYVNGSGGLNDLGNTTKRTGTGAPLAFGIQYFWASIYEWMEGVAINVQSFANFRAKKRQAATGDKVDGVWHIADPMTWQERTVQGVTSGSGNNIARVAFGRYADIVPTRMSSDSNVWAEWYTDSYSFTLSTARVASRGGVSNQAMGGLACAYSNGASSDSSAGVGSRLAFSGDITFDD